MNAEPIIDPRDGRTTTVYELGRETGVSPHIIWQRYESQGIRSMTLLAPKGAPIDAEAERLAAYQMFLHSRVGILRTCPLGEFSRTLRQQSGRYVA